MPVEIRVSVCKAKRARIISEPQDRGKEQEGESVSPDKRKKKYQGRWGCVRNDDNVLAPLKFHDDGLETDHDIAVRFSPSIPVVVLVVVPCLKIFGIFLGDLLVLWCKLRQSRIKEVERK